ncbi:MAG: LysR family transcriptional regulator [Comamonadaceae bacterium]|nr:MAG: LysR family transcriptional regulator [Comamonadaceae bacterium]
MLALMENVEEETASRSDELRGQLRITCSMSLAYAQMVAAVVDFLKLHPQLSRGEERTQVSVSNHFSANEATALLRAALAGGGIALQPTYLVNPYLQDGSLQLVLPDWKVPDMPSRKHLSPAVRALLDFLVQRFANTPW